MSVSYQAVGWNAFKKRYDWISSGIIVAFIVAFMIVGMLVHSKVSPGILLMRAFAVAAFGLLHVVLAIGPLSRFDSRWLPILYNRRHLGVSMFLLAFLHGVLAILNYHVGSDMNPIVSVFTTDSGTRMTAIPFQVFGFLALMILFVMAATSHDFWLANLSAPVWKTLHMGVYMAYVLLVAHVMFGVLQSETHPVYLMVILTGLISLGGLHLTAGWSQRGKDNAELAANKEGYVDVCGINELIENEPLGATVNGERVAVVLYEKNKISCVSGVCQHQNGPLAEGQFKYGCLTCPWHGYQYKLDDGASPDPFTEKIPIFEVKLQSNRVLVKQVPFRAGTPVSPALISGEDKDLI